MSGYSSGPRRCVGDRHDGGQVAARATTKGSDLRLRLLRAATEQIRAKGVEGFSLRETARTVGVDPAMVYREFTDRADLVESVALEAFLRLAEEVRDECAAAAATAADPPAAKLDAMGRTYIRFALRNPTEFRMMFAGGRRRVLPTSTPSAYDQLLALLDELDAAGRLRRSRDETVLVCWSTVHGAACLLVDQGLTEYTSADPEAVAQVVVSHLVLSITAPD